MTMWELTDDPASEEYDINAFKRLKSNFQQWLILLSLKLEPPIIAQTNILASSNNVLAKTALPKRALSKFYRDNIRWRQFHDLLMELVHKQIPNRQKIW